jgi:flagellar biosynthesis/type III secretory pathway chaperone
VNWTIQSKIASDLEHLLDQEFEALKAQNLDLFERLQESKAKLIGLLSQRQLPAEQAKENTDWLQFQDAVTGCRDKHRRNSILIQRKLDAIKAALRTLQGADNSSSVEVYDRLGRLSASRRRASYKDV